MPGAHVDYCPVPDDRIWFAWYPVRAGGAFDGSRKAGWVWLVDVEVIVKPRPGDDRANAVGGVYRKLMRSPPKFATGGLVRPRSDERIEPRVLPYVCHCPTCEAHREQRATRPPVRGEADQFGGPRIVKPTLPADYPAFLEAAARSGADGLTYDEWKGVRAKRIIVDRRDGPYMPEGGD